MGGVRTNSNAAHRATVYGPASTRPMAFGAWEQGFVADKRRVRASWAEIARMLGVSEPDVRAAFDAEWPDGGGRLCGLAASLAAVERAPLAKPTAPAIVSPPRGALSPQERRALRNARRAACGLTPAEAAVLAVLCRRNVTRLDDLMAALYGAEARARPDRRHLPAQFVSKLRRKLFPEVRIEGLATIGWTLAPACRLRALALLSDPAEPAPTPTPAEEMAEASKPERTSR